MGPRFAISNSESESEAELQQPPSPSKAALEKALRDAVAKVYRTGKMEELTVKRIRLAAEKTLQLAEGFFKSTGDWKTRSDSIIKDEVEVQDATTQKPRSDSEEEVPVKQTKRSQPKASSTSRKRRKTRTSEPEESEVLSSPPSGLSEEASPKSTQKQPKVPHKRKTKEIVENSDANGEEDAKSLGGKADPEGDSESEMSVVLDEEPQPKRQWKKNTGTAPAKARKTKVPAKGKDADLDPNQTEIKRLQGWLIKCGIRKMWARELAPYDTPKAKVKHLKDMLQEAGMEGRYSLEKAKQIREERELKADLELVQEGAKRWGKGSGDEEGSESGQPRRRLNRGRQSLAFLESDGEETD